MSNGFLGKSGLFPDDVEGAGNVRGQHVPQCVKVAAEVIGKEELFGELIIEVVQRADGAAV